MTREEAISQLISLSEEDVNVYSDAVEYAIEALEQEPCEDCISRQAVLEVIRKCHCEEWVKADIAAPIEVLPPVTPAEKVGKWIMLDDGLYRPICNNCGAHPWKGYIPTVEEATEVFKYCPKCGCRMQEAENG